MTDSSNVFIIAEAGVNHNGEIELAKELCRVAKEAGADCVKFQTYRTEDIVVKQAELTACQRGNSSVVANSQFELLKSLELSYEDFREIKSYCDSIDIVFLSTPDEKKSLDFLCELGLPVIKIGSGELNNLPFLREVGKKGKEVILSTGMSTLEEVGAAIEAVLSQGLLREHLSILHCTSAYPTPYSDVNLKAMQTLKDTFKVNVGYSDHTLGIEVSIAAVALGAVIIEKHFTVDRNLPGPDHGSSIEPSELKRMIESIRNVERCLGNGAKEISASEKSNRIAVRKSLVASCEIKEGEVFSLDNLAFKRPGLGLVPSCLELLLGRKAKKSYLTDELISPQEIE